MSKADLFKNLDRARKLHEKATEQLESEKLKADRPARRKAQVMVKLAQDNLVALEEEWEEQEDVIEEIVVIQGYRPRSSQVSHLEKDPPRGKSFAQVAFKRG